MLGNALCAILTSWLLPFPGQSHHDGRVMENGRLALGIILMVVGVALVIVAVFRALGQNWSLGKYEMWLLPFAGVGLILLGRWLIQ